MSANSSIDYLSKDFEGFRAALLDFASREMPEWQSRSEGDFGVTLVELMSYMGDVLSYYGDRIQAEAYLPTATQRVSLLQIASLLGYIPSNGVAASGTVTFENTTSKPVTVLAGTQVITDTIKSIDAPLTYETTADVTVPATSATVTGAATATVVHGVTRSGVILGISSGTPSQQFRIPETSVLADTVRIFVANGTDANGKITTAEWIRLDYLVDADGNDLAFSLYTDEYGSTWVEFGDGINGAIPNTGLNCYVTYRVGGGAVANVAAGQINNIANPVAGVQIQLASDGKPVTSAMTGGADAESNEQIRANAPRVFRAQNRAVTLQDFADTALAVPGVLRANAVAGTYTSVTVYIVGPNGLAPSANLIALVQSSLQKRALAGTSVTVAPAVFKGVNVGISSAKIGVTVYDRYKQAAVQQAVVTAIKTLLSFANVDFGMRLTVSDFYSTIMSVPGVKYVTIPVIARADASQSGTADLVFRPWEIPTVGSVNVNANGGIL